jgi:2,3-bisphosphoglycerate-independent phosphoglycerate mutase
MKREASVTRGRALAEAVRKAYSDGQTDYTMEPLVQTHADGTPAGTIEPGDAVIFCCRRGEREIELTDAFTAADFPHFERKALDGLSFVILTMYHEKYTNLPIAFAPSKIEETLAQCVSAAGLRQLHCAESERIRACHILL